MLALRNEITTLKYYSDYCLLSFLSVEHVLMTNLQLYLNTYKTSSFPASTQRKKECLEDLKKQSRKDTVLSRKEDFVRDHFSHYAAN